MFSVFFLGVGVCFLTLKHKIKVFLWFFLILSLKNRGVCRKLNINFIKIVVINIEYPLFGNHLWHIDNSSLKEAKK